MKKIIQFTITFTALVVLLFVAFGVSAKDFPRCSEWARETLEKANRGGLFWDSYYTVNFTTDISRGEIACLVVTAYENATGKVAGEGESFDDAPMDRYVSAVRHLGIMNGKGENLFKPFDFTTREEMAKVILSLKSVVEGTEIDLSYASLPQFSDFETSGEWARGYIAKVAELGIMNGRADGRFSPKDRITYEEAVALIVRAIDLPQYEIPNISIDSSSVLSNDMVSVTSSNCNDFSMYDYMMGDGYGESIFVDYTQNGRIALSKQMLEDNLTHYLFAVSDKGVCSLPSKYIVVSDSLDVEGVFDPDTQSATVSWNFVPDITTYSVSITENRHSVGTGRIPYGETKTFEVSNENSFTFDAPGNYRYSVSVYAGGYVGECEIEAYAVKDHLLAAEINRTYPTTKEEAQAMQVQIVVPIWKIVNGKKVASQVSLTVHHLLADKYKAVFDDIFNGEEKFPVKSIGAYSWRGRRSEHNGGTAIDINPEENYCVYGNGTVVGSYWKPFEDIYSISPYSDVVKAFERHGFSWGGDVWGEKGTIDYMHFSYLGT